MSGKAPMSAKKRIAFSDWFLEEPSEENDCVGKIADYVRSRPDWPTGASRKAVWDYIVCNGERFFRSEVDQAYRKYIRQK